MKKYLICLLAGLGVSYTYAQKVQWEKTIGGKHSEYLFDMTPTPDYGFLLAGSSFSGKSGGKTSPGSGNLDYWIWKMDKDGEEEWQMSFGASGRDLLQRIVPTPDAGYLLAGTSNSGKGGLKAQDAKGKNDLWLIKIDAAGGVQWETTIGGKGDDQLSVVQKLSDGYIIGSTTNSPVSGDKTSLNKGGTDFWLIRLDNKGVLKWQQSFGGYYNDDLTSILPTEKGFLVAGSSNSPAGEDKTDDSFGGYDIWVLELDTEGRLLNQKVFGGEQDDKVTALLPFEEGYLIAGSSASESGGNKTTGAEKGNDFWVIKTDKKLEITDQFGFDFKGDDYLTSVVPDKEGRLLLAGYSINTEGKKSYVAVKTDGKGENLWEKKLSTNGDDLLRKVVSTRDGGYVFAGNSTGKHSGVKKGYEGRNDYWVVKLHTEEKVKDPEIKLEAFPNPTEGYTRVVLNHEYKEGQFSVLDVSGRVLYTEVLQYDMATVNLTGYPKGVYIVHIKTDVLDASVKIIKK